MELGRRCGNDVARHLAGRSEVMLIRNDKPERGMSHSRTPANRAGEPGHPVVLSPGARRFIHRLLPGDTIRSLRAVPELVARDVETADEGGSFDVDTIGAFER